eukprot:EC813548.1.p5 GENE.EC813548.1~~EC813548.1.p5  ORF type:complete len:54 (-),score=10.33 EC813548.1:13-174(-)
MCLLARGVGRADLLRILARARCVTRFFFLVVVLVGSLRCAVVALLVQKCRAKR